MTLSQCAKTVALETAKEIVLGVNLVFALVANEQLHVFMNVWCVCVCVCNDFFKKVDSLKVDTLRNCTCFVKLW